MKTFKRSFVLQILVLIILLSNPASLQPDQVLIDPPTPNLLNVLLKHLNEPSANGGVRIQRMSSITKAGRELSEEESAEASTIDHSNQVYRYPVVKITNSNYTQFARQHEWIYVKFFTEWCPHSRAIIPTWHDVSYRLSTTPIAVAEVQCEVDDDKLCETFKVVAYPSFKLIRKGVIRQALIGEIKDADRLVNEAWKVYLKEGKSG